MRCEFLKFHSMGMQNKIPFKVPALAACLLLTCCGRSGSRADTTFSAEVEDVTRDMVSDGNVLVAALKSEKFHSAYLLPETLRTGGVGDEFSDEVPEIYKVSPASTGEIALIESGPKMREFENRFSSGFELSSGSSLRGLRFKLLLISNTLQDVTLVCVKSERRWFICMPDQQKHERDKRRGKTWFKMNDAFSAFMEGCIVKVER